MCPSEGLGSPTRPEEPPVFVPYSDAVGVGSNEPPPETEVRGSDLRCRESRPVRIEPCCGQVPENVSDESPSNETWNVLQDDVTGSSQQNGSGDGGPEPTGIFGAEAESGDAGGLAGKPGSDDIASCGGDGVRVTVDRDAGEPLREDALAVAVELAELHGPVPGPFEAEVEEPDA